MVVRPQNAQLSERLNFVLSEYVSVDNFANHNDWQPVCIVYGYFWRADNDFVRLNNDGGLVGAKSSTGAESAGLTFSVYCGSDDGQRIVGRITNIDCNSKTWRVLLARRSTMSPPSAYQYPLLIKNFLKFKASFCGLNRSGGLSGLLHDSPSLLRSKK